MAATTDTVCFLPQRIHLAAVSQNFDIKTTPKIYAFQSRNLVYHDVNSFPRENAFKRKSTVHLTEAMELEEEEKAEARLVPVLLT